MFDDPANNSYAHISKDVISSTAHTQLALEAAHQSMVLLRNDHAILPINKFVCMYVCLYVCTYVLTSALRCHILKIHKQGDATAEFCFRMGTKSIMAALWKCHFSINVRRDKYRRVALIGPNAHHGIMQLGNYNGM